MKNTFLKSILGLASLVTIGTGCNTAAPTDSNNVSTYVDGIFVLNEGNFGNGTGTVTHINKKDKTVTQDLFKLKNSYDLGNVANSMTIADNVLYMVINNANKIEKADLKYFRVAPKLIGFNSPRYYASVQAGKAYVSQWGNGGKVMVVNPQTFNIVDSINVGAGPENILVDNTVAYVACSGGFGYNNTVQVINTQTNNIVKTWYAGPAPESMQLDANGKLWVLCQGKYNASFTGLDSNARLVKFNIFTNSIEQSIDLGSAFSLAHDLKIDNSKSTLYFAYNGKIHSMAVNASTPSVFVNRDFYTLAVDKATGHVIGGDAGDYTSAGKIIRYNSTTANAVDSFATGIIPGDIIFN